jgi:hypothetical protein
MFERPVVRFLGILREAAGGQFPALEVVPDAFAAHPFAAARGVGAGTALKICCLFAFHGYPPILRVKKALIQRIFLPIQILKGRLLNPGIRLIFS